jgi:hypothetical protein
MRERPTVPCKVCGTPTPYTGTKLCNNCFETTGRLSNTLYAEKVYSYLTKEYRVRVLTSAFLGAPDDDSTEYNILAASEMDARVMAFVMDGGTAGGELWVDECTIELAKMYTEVLG